MTVSAKGRRRISVDGRTYVWWVVEDAENFVPGSCHALTVVSADRQFFVRYALGQPDATRHVVVLGPRFREVPDCGGCWRRFRSPAFFPSDEVQPSAVAEFIRWALEDGPAPVEVDYMGEPLR